MNMNGSLIRLREVSFGYGPDRPVLECASMNLRRGERIGLTGANGSGKTTLLHLLVGLLRPARGEVEVFGRVRGSEDDFREVRAKVGLLFQDPEDQLFCPTVAEDVAFGPFNLGMTRGEVESVVRDTLDQLGLRGFEDRITYRLSFGEKRLVSLAAVLAMKPQVLLLDEPTSGLDADSSERITDVLNELDLPMLVASHDVQFLRRITSSHLALDRAHLAPGDPGYLTRNAELSVQ